MRGLSALSLVALLFPLTAVAQDDNSGVYLELRGGPSFLQDADFGGDFGGINVDGDVKFDPGGVIELAVGYAFGGGLRSEFSLGHHRNEIDEIEVEALGVTVSTDIDGHVSSVMALASLYYDFITSTNLTPFIGAGLGVAGVEVGGDDVEDDSDTVLAYQAVGGLAYRFTPSITGSIAYAFRGTPDVEVDGEDFEYDSHNLIVGIRYSF